MERIGGRAEIVTVVCSMSDLRDIIEAIYFVAHAITVVWNTERL